MPLTTDPPSVAACALISSPPDPSYDLDMAPRSSKRSSTPGALDEVQHDRAGLLFRGLTAPEVVPEVEPEGAQLGDLPVERRDVVAKQLGDRADRVRCVVIVPGDTI